MVSVGDQRHPQQQQSPTDASPLVDLLNLRPEYGMEEFKGLFDSVDLFDGIELGDIDVAEADLSNLFESSDSDSGISLSCDVKSAVLKNIELTIPGIKDCILTDAIIATDPEPKLIPQPCSIIVNSVPSKGINNVTSCAGKSIRVVKISQNNPNHITAVNIRTTTAATIENPISTQPVECFTRTAPIRINSNPTQLHFQSSSNIPYSSEESELLSPYVGSCIKQEPDEFESSFFNAPLSVCSRNEFAQNDPLGSPDLTLGKHLQQMSNLNSSTPSNYHQLHSPNPFLPDDGFITHTGLERIRKKQERMIKNRHAASMSRQRKKEYLERLEVRYDQLKRENLNLWRQNEEWRLRCDQMERCLRDLQSQLTKSDFIHADPHSSTRSHDPTPTKMARLIGPTESSATAELRASTVVVDQTPTYSTSPLMPCGSTTARTSLTSLSSASATTHDHSSPSWHVKPTQPTVRKIVANSVFYSGHSSNGSPSATGGHHGNCSDSSVSNNNFNQTFVARKPFRPNLIKLTGPGGGVISRSRSLGLSLQSNRSKLVATTSLFSLFCMCSLNLFLPVFPPQDTARLSTPWRFAPDNYPKNSAPYLSVGQRTLLSWSDPTNSVHPEVPTSTTGHDQKTTTADDVASAANGADQLNSTSTPNIASTTSVHESDKTADAAPSSVQCKTVSNSQKLPETSEDHSSHPPTSSSPYFDMDYSTLSSRNDRLLAVLNHSERTARNSQPNRPHQLNKQTHPTIDLSSSITKTQSLSSLLHSRRSHSAKRSLSLFHRYYDRLNVDAILETDGRRNDTIYLFLTHFDQDYLRLVDPLYQNLSTKLTLIVPAYAAKNDSHGSAHSADDLQMLRVDFELRNVSLIHQPPPPTPQHTTTKQSGQV